MNTDAIRRFLIALSSTLKIEQGQLYQLIQSAEAGYHLRDVHAQREIGLALQAFGYPFNQVGKYYESIYLYRTGQFEKARKLLECVADSAPARYRSKALFSLSAVEERLGRFEESLRLRLQILTVDDPVLSLQTQQSIAILRSREGEHRAALRDLERLMPLAHIIGQHGHPAYVTFLNSYAVELSESNRTQEAEQVANVIAASPLIGKYPEWQETVSEIRTKRKCSSVIALASWREPKPRDLRIQLAIDFMNANYQQSIALPELARVASISQSHFSRMFKNETGLSPIDYLIRLRTEKARDLLKNPSLSIKEVMVLTGFNARSNFVRHFRQYFRNAPSEYRKMIR